MDGSLLIPPPASFVLTSLTLADLDRMNAEAQTRRRPHRQPRRQRPHVIVPPSLWLPLGGEPLILLAPEGFVDPPATKPNANREAWCKAQAETWALENASADDYGEAYLYALGLFTLGRKPSVEVLAKRLRRSEFGAGREVSALEFDDGTSVLDQATESITAGVASGDGDVDAMHLGGTVTFEAIRRYTPRWGLEEGHGKDGDWRRPLQHAYYSRAAGQMGFAGRLWTARAMGVAA